MFEDDFAKPVNDFKKVINNRNDYLKEMEKNVANPSAAAGALETCQSILKNMAFATTISSAKSKDEAFALCVKVSFLLEKF